MLVPHRLESGPDQDDEDCTCHEHDYKEEDILPLLWTLSTLELGVSHEAWLTLSAQNTFVSRVASALWIVITLTGTSAGF